MKIKKFILQPIAKPNPNIASSKTFLEKKKVPIEKNKKAHE